MESRLLGFSGHFSKHYDRMIKDAKSYVTFVSIVLFVGFVFFVSFAINRHINKTLSLGFSNIDGFIRDNSGIEDFSNSSTVEVIVKKGDCLNNILTSQGLTFDQATKITELLNSHNISTLKIGQKIIFNYNVDYVEDSENDLSTEKHSLDTIVVPIDKLNFVEIVHSNGEFTAKIAAVPVQKFISKATTVIDYSFLNSLKSINIPTSSIIDLVNAYSYKIDFQRQIQPGDKVTVIMEKFIAEDGSVSHYGKVLYASLELSGETYDLYLYSNGNNLPGQFFFENGKSAKSNLLKTPINVMRISSHYGNRKHPILGYTKMHRGVDFAAPEGTPIYAAGDGVVSEMAFKSGYGNFIQIKHSATLSTAYAHASKFAKNIKHGTKVKQGQVIAYVGRTGRTTGPHLHFEAKIAGQHVNPLSIKTTPGIELRGQQLHAFNRFKDKVHNLSNALESKQELAENEMMSF